MQDQARKIIVAEIDDCLVGYVSVHFNSTFGDCKQEIETLYIQEHYSGQGIGSALLKQVQLDAKKRSGNNQVWLTVNADNQRAINFYRKFSFAHAGETFFELEGTKHRNLVLITLNKANNHPA
jgi:ribosomal protein S18 acetylase RimI-like enzyme